MYMLNYFLFTFFNVSVVEAFSSNTSYNNSTVFDFIFNKLGILVFFLPEIFLSLTLIIILCIYVFQLEQATKLSFVKSYILVFISIFVVTLLLYIDLYYYYLDLIKDGILVNSSFFSSQLIVNPFSFLLKILTVFFLLIFFVISYAVIPYYRFLKVEHFVLISLSVLGSLVLASANDLLVFYLALEISTIPLYILVSSKSRCNFSTEGGLKYFIIGSFSSGLILFGFSFLYGFTGLSSFTDFNLYLNYESFIQNSDYFVIFGLLIFLFGLFIKIGIAPFHFWVIDVYAGAPILITLFMMTVPKIVLWGVSYSLVLDTFFVFFDSYISYLLAICIVGSFIFGIFPGLYQIKIKRLVIYSSIASNGFFLMSFFSGHASNLMVYLFIYIITVSGFFSFYFLLRNRSSLELITKISELNNYSKNNALIAYCGSFLLFSMAGIPPFAGFLGKFYLFVNTFSVAPYLIAISLLFGCVSTFYYIRISKWMFFANSLVPSAKNTWLFLVQPNRILVGYLVFAVVFNLSLILFFNSFLGIINSFF